MPNPNAPTDVWAAYESDTFIRVNANGLGSNSDVSATSLWWSRWNNADGTYGGETKTDGGTYNGIAPGSIGTVGNRIYRWRVRGKGGSSGGYGPYTYTGYVQTTPNAPSGASAWLSGPSAISISWQDNAYTPNYVYDTEIWWNINGGGWGLWTTVAAGTTSIQATGLSPGATYQFAVRHVERYGNLPSAFNYTATLTATNTPTTPGTLTASRTSDAQMALSWTNNSSGSAPYDSITVQRWDSVGQAWGTIATLSGSATSLTDTNTVAGRKYQYRIAANNAVGTSGWSTSGFTYTTPNAPTNANALYSGGTSISVSWTNNRTYDEQAIHIQPYEDGVAQTATVLTGTATSWTHTGIKTTSTYYYKVWAVSNTGSLASSQAQSNSVLPAQPPGAPSNLSASPVPMDLGRTRSISWTHTPSVDGSAQTKYQIRHKVQGAGTWTENAVVTSSTQSMSSPFATGYTNGQVIEWQVRTYGVHANPGPYSASSTVTTSTTPTVTITSPVDEVTTSTVTVAWSYFDQESTPQAEWSAEFINAATNTVIETKTASDTSSSTTFATPAENGGSYQVRVKVRDGSGVWSDPVTRSFVGDFTPPAEVLLQPELDANSGAAILTLQPTPDDGGVTTLPASSVTIERQFYDPEVEDYGPWETLIANVDPNVTLIDTTGPAHEDGHYRVTTYSNAPSSVKSTTYVKPEVTDYRWLYVSGGDKFDIVCRMWANIEIGWKASRNRSLHYFAERRRPVIYSGEASEKVLTVSGLIDDISSPPQQWLRLAQQPGPVLLRGPGQRIFGNLSEVSVERIQVGLHKVSFSIQEVGK